MFMALGQIADLTHMIGMESEAARDCFMDMGMLFWDMLVEPDAMPRVLAKVQEWADAGLKYH
jgi:hypothetical protein